MRYEDYVQSREARSPAFREAREQARDELAFARALIAARAAANLTQAELAERVGTKQPNIARLESGRYKPSVDMLERLARALHVSFEITGDTGLRVQEPVT